MRRVLASEARNDFSNLLNQVAFKNQPVIIQRNHKNMAALVPLERLKEAMFEIEKALDFEAARRARKRGGRIPIGKAFKKFGIDAP